MCGFYIASRPTIKQMFCDGSHRESRLTSNCPINTRQAVIDTLEASKRKSCALPLSFSAVRFSWSTIYTEEITTTEAYSSRNIGKSERDHSSTTNQATGIPSRGRGYIFKLFSVFGVFDPNAYRYRGSSCCWRLVQFLSVRLGGSMH